MEAYIFDALRTPRGRARKNGGLAEVAPIDLLTVLFRAFTDRWLLVPEEIDDVLLGCATPFGEQGSNLARIAAIYAGWGVRASGATSNRFCASGLDALHNASARVACGMADLVIAAGIEMPSRVPMMADGGAWFQDPRVKEKTGYIHMGVAADLLATLACFSREQLDGWALRSQERAAQALQKGSFQRSVIPVRVGGVDRLQQDECVRAETSMASLAALPVLFAEAGRDGMDQVCIDRYPQLERVQHLHTIGTSPAMADGASMALIGSLAAGQRLGLRPRGRVLAFADIATEPVLMLSGNPLATERALLKAKLSIDDIGLFEVNESFAAVPLHYLQSLGISEERVNIHGGAIALGHPLGATGITLLATLLDALDERNERYGVLSICAGAGIASATVIERLS